MKLNTTCKSDQDLKHRSRVLFVNASSAFLIKWNQGFTLTPLGLLQEQTDIRPCWKNTPLLSEEFLGLDSFYSCASVYLNTLCRSISMKIKEYGNLEFSICSFLSLWGQSSILRDANANSVYCSRANVSPLKDKRGWGARKIMQC